MKIVNHTYTDSDHLIKFVSENSIENSPSVLIQIFSSNASADVLNKLKDELVSLLPDTSIVATSTSGIVADGNLIDNSITVSFSVFEKSTTQSKSYCKLSIEEVLNDVSKTLINDRTKLLIVFSNTFTFDATKFLHLLMEKYPAIAVAGGNAGDDYKFEKCELFSKTCKECDVVIASIDSDSLQVETKYLLNWQTIGREMVVTKAEGAKVFEINNQKILDIYKHYLGAEVAGDLLQFGLDFPLIFEFGSVEVARAPVAVNEDGSVTFAGEINEGCKIKFGYANIEFIDNYTKNLLLNDNPYKNEAIYVYSCGARRMMLGHYLEDELSMLNKAGTTAGFITYGEFFHQESSCTNNILNLTTTYVTLNESEPQEKVVFDGETIEKDKKDITLKALTTLVSRTSDELDENIYYLEQFKNAVDEASIFSTTDGEGVITHVNKNFERISGYTKDELLGKKHNIIRHKDVPKEVFAEMWATITKGEIWKGLVKNRSKSGRPYYVISQIVPIYNIDGSFREYISIRNDVTELEEYKQILQRDLDLTNKSLEANVNYIAQYEEAINSATAILKTDNQGKIKFVNDKFCQLSGYDKKEVIGMQCDEMRHKKHREVFLCAEVRKHLNDKKPVTDILYNIRKDGSEYVCNTLFYPIVNLDNQVTEHLQVMHDITEVVELNKDIIETQKEVVFTMSAIGETRSKETGLHVKRVAEYSYLLAKMYGLSEEEAQLLKQASPMHDIGKVGIPDSVLNKPGKLDSAEWEVMQTHATLGYNMLKHSKREILKAASIVAHEHHEKYDGNGYPRRLKGEDIHIYGRITAVADVFDALGHDRVYKKAWELDKILELFEEETGKHFDPKLIEIFMENLDKFLELKKQFDD